MVLEVIYVVRHGVSTSSQIPMLSETNAFAAARPFLSRKRSTTTKHSWIILLVDFDLHILTTNVVPFTLGCQRRNRRLHRQRSKSNRNSLRPSPHKLWRKASRRIGNSYLDVTTSNRRHIFQSVLQMSPDHQAAGGEAVDSAESQERQG